MPNFARGVKLNIEHVYPPLTALATDIGDAQLEAAEQQANTHFQWTLNFLNARMFVDPENRLCLPFMVPPFQQSFDSTTQRATDYPVVLREVSISFDQRAEPQAITDIYNAITAGFVTAEDLARYTTVIKLCCKTPTILGGTPTDRTVLYSFTIPGVEAYGSPDFRSNPLIVDNVNIPLHPYKTYWWEVTMPSLNAPAANGLSLPSWTLHAVCSSPLTTRDRTGDGTQNLPNIHGGAPQTWAGPTITTPSADAIIDGTTDLQASFSSMEQPFLNKLKAGYGTSPGLESDVYPQESLAKDSAYSIIIVPMWQGYEDLRSSEVATSGIPYVGAPWQNPTIDRRLLVIPKGFTLHHAFAIWSLNAPPCPGFGGNATWATFPTSNTFTNKVGIAINSGPMGDDYKYQQVAYAEWTPANYTTVLVDTFQPYVNDPTIPNMWNVHAIPLVSDNVGVPDGYITTGPPFYMGESNTRTQARTLTGDMPTLFGGAAYASPLTNGTETVLEVRWLMVDAVNGLNHPADPDAVKIGTGGHWVVLCGKATITE